MKFGTPDSYKFAPKYADNGLLYVSAYANAFMSGKVVKEIDLGTHTMFVAQMTDGEVLSDKPSMTYEYYLANIKPRPEQKKTGWAAMFMRAMCSPMISYVPFASTGLRILRK